MKKLDRLEAELATHGNVCDCSTKKVCEDREEGLTAEIQRLKGLHNVKSEFWESAEKDVDILTAALREIADPVSAMRARLQPDEQLSGSYAVMLSNDPNYLKEIARKALAAIE